MVSSDGRQFLVSFFREYRTEDAESRLARVVVPGAEGSVRLRHASHTKHINSRLDIRAR